MNERKILELIKNVLSLSGSLFVYGSDPALGLEVSYIRYIGKYIGVYDRSCFSKLDGQ